MCGIAGCFFDQDAFDADDRQRLARLSEALAHRGPDGEGETLGARFAFAHRRLAVQDLSDAGRQPMRHASGLHITFNGEIYNAPSLRDELEAEGESFRGHSDTEVLLAACVRWGLDAALARLNGMFAFALADESSGRGWLVRDRLGIKPLFHGRDARGRLWFASELEPLMRHAPLDTAFDVSALAGYARHAFIAAPATAYKGVRALQPARVLASDPSATPRCYWEIPVRQESWQGGEEAATAAFEAALRAALQRRLLSDVPLGAFLSGGLDSSAIAALLVEGGTTLDTYSIGYENEPAIDESGWANAVAHHLGTKHTLFRVGPDDVREAIHAVVGRQGQPFADPSLVPSWLVARLARRHVTVALSGDGADEILGGYNKYLVESFRARVSAIPALLRGPLLAAASRLPSTRFSRLGERLRQVKKFAGAAGQPAAERWSTLQGLLPESGAADALFAGPLRGAPPPSSVRERLEGPDRGLTGMLEADLAVTLPDRMLFKVDQASMASALEVRVPFLDHELVELAARLPLDHLVRGAERKRILRRIALPRLPPESASRPKRGFDFPAGRWLAGPLRELFLDQVRSESARELVDAGAVEDLLERHRAGRIAADFALWTVFVLALWASETQQSSS